MDIDDTVSGRGLPPLYQSQIDPEDAAVVLALLKREGAADLIEMLGLETDHG